MNIWFKLILKCLVITHFHGLLLLLSSMKFSKNMVEDNGIEPLTPCVQGRCSPS